MYDYDLSGLYVFGSGLHSRAVLLYGSDNELSESGESEQDDTESGNDNQDYTIYFDDLITNTDLCVAQNEQLIQQVDLLNSNLVILHNDLKIGIGFGFVLMVYICIKCAFGIFNTNINHKNKTKTNTNF